MSYVVLIAHNFVIKAEFLCSQTFLGNSYADGNVSSTALSEAVAIFLIVNGEQGAIKKKSANLEFEIAAYAVQWCVCVRSNFSASSVATKP